MMPVGFTLAPRGYLSSFTKIGTIFLLALGVIIVNPEFQMPALSEYVGGGGPIVPGPLFPFCFITIACGAISGFHALISSGTTPKMIDKESDIRRRLRASCRRRRRLMALKPRHHGPATIRDHQAPAGLRNMTFQGQALAPGERAGDRAGGGEP